MLSVGKEKQYFNANFTYKQKERWIDFRQELDIFRLGERVKEYKHNYLGHILRMPTNRIPRNLFGCHPKG
jgi:hypothetical protein